MLATTFISLQGFWFALIGVLWAGFLVLEGFDFGVGMLSPLVGRDESGRRAALGTIAPVWDGNEVWLIVAGGATFAAFPNWYATLFSGFYIVLFLILIGLIVRGVAIEYRAKREQARWKAIWDLGIFAGSAIPAFFFGLVFANVIHGVPLLPTITGRASPCSGLTLPDPRVRRRSRRPLQRLRDPGRIRLAGSVRVPRRRFPDPSYRGKSEEARPFRRALPRRAGDPTRGLDPALEPGRLRLEHGQVDRRRDPGRSRRGPARPLAAARLQEPRRLRLRRHRACDRLGDRDAVRRALSARARLEHRLRHEPDRRLVELFSSHALGDDDRGADLHADRARLPGLDLLGLPRPAARGAVPRYGPEPRAGLRPEPWRRSIAGFCARRPRLGAFWRAPGCWPRSRPPPPSSGRC